MQLKAEVRPLPWCLLWDNAASTKLVAAVCLGHTARWTQAGPRCSGQRIMKVTALGTLASGSCTKHKRVEGDNPESGIAHVLHEPKEKSVLIRKPRAPHTQHNLEDPDKSSWPHLSFSEITL